MLSLKAFMRGVGLDTNAPLSVMGNFFGFTRGTPRDPDASVPAVVSIVAKLEPLRGKHFNVNVIAVGSDRFTAAQWEDLDYAIYRAHQIFADAGLGVGRVERFFISAAESAGRNDLGSEDEAEDLTQEWTVPNNGIDAFVVENISDSDFIGISPRCGPCDKDAKGMNGCIAGEVNLGGLQLARTFSHELGHYLGLPHNHGDSCPSTTAGRDNLMAQSRCDNNTRTSVLLTSSQRSDIRGHCSVRSGI